MRILVLIFLLPTILLSQKEYCNWYFGYHSGITFNTPNEEPIYFDGNLSTGSENLSIISDSTGNLKYYSNLHCLYNQNEKVFCNRDTVVCPFSSSQGSILLNLGKNNFIYIGTNFEVESFTSPTFLSFFIFKDVNSKIEIVKNDTILSGFNGENVLAIRDFNSNSFYLIANDRFKSLFYLYKFNISTESFELLHTLPSQYEFDINNKVSMAGFLKSSLDGKIIASNHSNLGIEILEFDSIDEKLKFKYKLETTDRNFEYHSSEFSPNSQYLYYIVGRDNFEYINRFNFKSGLNSPSIEELTKITNRPSVDVLLMGPNMKIYTNSPVSNYLSSIEFPNETTKIGFIEKSVKLDDETTAGFLPNIPTTYYNLLRLPDTTFACPNKDIQLTSVLYAPFKDTIYSWTGPNDFKSDLPNPTISNGNSDDEGYYYLTVFNGDSSVSYQRKTYVKILPNPIPEIKVAPSKIVCSQDTALLSVPKGYVDFVWTTGENTHTITVNKSGTYGVNYTNEYGCTGYAEVNITFEQDMTIDIEGEKEFCKGSSTTLSVHENYESFLWSTGDIGKETVVDKEGKYWLTVTTAEGCIITDTIEIEYHPKITAELKPTPTTVCNGDSTLLEAKYYSPYYSFEWSTGAKTRGIYASQTGTYKLRITDTRTGCTDSTEIAIKVEDNLQPTITGSNICSGQSATLEALPNDPSYSYEWSNGASTPVIEVNQTGTYTVTVSKAGCGGTAEFTVEESPQPEFTILGESIICNNKSAVLSADNDFDEYLWSTNEITKEIEVTEAGTYTLTVTDENGCSATKSFKVEKYELSFDISKNSIDFGKVYITETKNEIVTLTNKSGFAITLENGDEVQDGQNYDMNYDFTPTELGFFGDGITVHIASPCDTVITLPITARVYARATISTEDIYTEIGRTESVPVYLECEADLTEQEYTITTDIDRSAFNTNDSYTINQNQPISKTRTKIHELTGTVLLSDSLEYDITFPSYKFNNTYIEVTDKPGKIYIDSICVFDYRNIAFTEPTTLITNPNPATEQLNISITTGVQGTLQLELVSTEGRVIYSDSWQQSTRSKQLQINTKEIPSGLYQLRLITPYDAVTTSVVVVE